MERAKMSDITSGSGQAKRESQVRSELSQLEDTIQHLRESVDRLGDRLSEVTNPAASAPTCDEVASLRNLVPLASRIRDININTNGVRDLVTSIIERLEL